MKQFLHMFMLFLLHYLAAQEPDRRAVVDLRGNFSSLSVLPDGNIWIATLTGDIYHGESFGTDWHTVPFAHSGGRPSFSGLRFFDSLHGIMIDRHESVLATSDAGITWQNVTPAKDAFYSITTGGNSSAWMAGKSRVYYSADFGQTWAALPASFPRTYNFYSVCMQDSQQGLLYGDDKYLYTTRDNWKTYSTIKVPKQGKTYLRPFDAFAGNGQMVVRAGTNAYISKFGKNGWKPADMAISALLPDGGRLFAVSLQRELLQFDGDRAFKVIADSVPKAAYAMKQGILFAAGHDFLYRIENGKTSILPYCTSEYRIPEPYCVSEGPNLSWGADGRHLYVCHNDDRNWRRTKILPFDVLEITQQADSSAILWDGQTHHRFDLASQHLSVYRPENPLREFLRVPLKNFSITTTNSGSGHFSMDSISFAKSADSLFCSKRLFEVDDNRSRTSNCSMAISAKKVVLLLEMLDAGYDKPLSLSEFGISEEDRRVYLENARTRSRYAQSSKQEKKALSDYYAAFASGTGQKMDVKPFFGEPAQRSTSMEAITVRFVNENDEVLLVSNIDLHHQVPWHLPWLVHYGSFSYKTGEVAFSRFVDGCTPKGFMGKSAFSNPQLLMELADFFYMKSGPGKSETIGE